MTALAPGTAAVPTNEDDARAQFTERTANHVMTVLHDDGMYRHLAFYTPGTGIDGFEVVTWPGHISITGDMGETVMKRDMDMLDFVAKPGSDRISFHYWLEKVVANDGPTQEFSLRILEDRLREAWTEHCEDRGVEPDSDEAGEWWDELREEILDTDHGYGPGDERECMDALNSYVGEVGIYDTSEWDCQEVTFHLHWRFLALRFAANMYFAGTAAV